MGSGKDYRMKLTDFFKDEELEWKPQSTGIDKTGKPWAKVLCYVSARAIQERLDDVYGVTGWKDTYRFEPHGTICSLSVWDQDKKEWITKENGSQETDIESFKGGISSALKRVAASGYGIGRYLYALDTVFAECSKDRQKDWKYAKDKKTDTYFYWKSPIIDSKYRVKPETVGRSPEQQRSEFLDNPQV